MRKTILIMVIAAVLALSGCSFLEGTPTTYEAESYSIELPGGFYEEYEGAYLDDNKGMFYESRYYANELDMDVELMSDLILYTEYYEEDILSVDTAEIDGYDVVQAEYKTLATGMDDIHYYYFGVMTFFKLDDSILVVDGYIAMEEADGINADISDEDRQTIFDIADTIQITDEGYVDYDITPEKISADVNTLNLSDNWFEAVDGENGMYDFGYYALYENYELYMYYEFDAYNDANANDLEYIKENAQSFPEYTAVGQTTVAGEHADIYKYENLDDEAGAYIHGVLVVSQHYWVDTYFYSYNDDFEFNEDTVDNIVDYMTDIQ